MQNLNDLNWVRDDKQYDAFIMEIGAWLQELLATAKGIYQGMPTELQPIMDLMIASMLDTSLIPLRAAWTTVLNAPPGVDSRQIEEQMFYMAFMTMHALDSGQMQPLPPPYTADQVGLITRARTRELNRRSGVKLQ